MLKETICVLITLLVLSMVASSLAVAADSPPDGPYITQVKNIEVHQDGTLLLNLLI